MRESWNFLANFPFPENVAICGPQPGSSDLWPSVLRLDFQSTIHLNSTGGVDERGFYLIISSNSKRSVFDISFSFNICV